MRGASPEWWDSARPRLARLKRRKLIRGKAEALVEVKAGAWHEPKNLG